MDLSIKSFYQNQIFNARNPRYTKEFMDKTLLPILNKEDANIDMMVKESNYTYHAVLKWFQESLGMSAAKFFKLRKLEKLKNELIDFYNKNTPEHEIAKFYNYSVGWVQKQFLKFKIRETRQDLNDRLAKKAPLLLKEGYTQRYIAEDVECSQNTLRKWITKSEEVKEENVVDYRHKNNIRIKREYKKEELELKQKLEILFAEGKGPKEVSKILNITQSKVLYWKGRFNLKTKKEEAVERMRILVPKFMSMKMSIKAMAKEIGEISSATVRRFIKEEYGKNYIDIRMNK